MEEERRNMKGIKIKRNKGRKGRAEGKTESREGMIAEVLVVIAEGRKERTEERRGKGRKEGKKGGRKGGNKEGRREG